MMHNRLSLRSAFTFLALACAVPLAQGQVIGQPVLGLVQNGNSLVRFTTDTPGTIGAPVAVTGLTAGDTLKAIDYRPATGMLYAIATDVTNAAVRTTRPTPCCVRRAAR